MKEVYTLADLENEDFNKENEKPIRLAVIGNPIAHSKSPQMQQAALDSAGIDVSYIRIHVEEEHFARLIGVLKEKDFIGANVTVPYKHNAFLLCDNTDPLATATEAVNTLVFRQDGTMDGFNTDGPGFAMAIRNDFAMDLKDLRISIIGATGGAGVALAFTCAMNDCEALFLLGRSEDGLRELYDHLSNYFVSEFRLSGAMDRLKTAVLTTLPAKEALTQSDLIINASALGLRSTDPSPIPSSSFEPYHLVYDLQTHEDSFQREAQMRGARVSNGLSMLVYQGALAFEKWFGRTADVKAMKKALGR